MSVGVGELLVESDGLADGEAVGDFVGLTLFFGFGLPVARDVADGDSRTRVGVGVGVGVGLVDDGAGVGGAELICCAVVLRTSAVFPLEVWLVR